MTQYGLILKIKTKLEDISTGLSIDQIDYKTTKFLNRIKKYIDADAYDILHCVQVRAFARGM